MKKMLLLSAILIGVASVSQAAVRFDLGLGLPLPPLPGVVFSRPAPVVVAPDPPVCETPPPVCSTPEPQAYYAPAPYVVAPPAVYFGFGSGRYDYRDRGYHSRDGHHWDYRNPRGSSGNHDRWHR